MMIRSIHCGRLRAWFLIAVVASVNVASLRGDGVDRQVEGAIRHLAPHPRLLLPPAGLDALRGKVATNQGFKAVQEKVLEDAGGFLVLPVSTRTLEGRRLLNVSRESVRRILCLGYAWKLTHDPRFSRRAKEELCAVAAFGDWNPAHFLDVAEMTTAVAIGYDWLYPELDEPTRAMLCRAIIDKGLKPSLSGRQSWIAGTNNWNQVCHGGMVIGALAVADREPKLAADIISRAVRNLPHSMDGYNPDGAYPEGATYWGYGTTYNVLLVASLESALGTDFGISRHHGFLSSPDYMLRVTAPGGNFFNYSDCGLEFGMNVPLYWFAKRLNRPDLLWFEQRNLSDAAHRRLQTGHELGRFLPLVLVWGDPAMRATPPGKLDWVSGGPTPVAFFRSGWQPDACYVGIKGGSPSSSHAHMDAGSFIFEADGVRWAHDLGSEGYTAIEKRGIDLWNMKQNSPRWNIFRLSNHAHGTLSIDGGLQQVAGRATITARGLESSTPTAIVDCTSLYATQVQSVRRTFSLPNRRSLLIQDEFVSMRKAGSVRWQMVTKADISISGGDAILREKGKTLRVHRVIPDQAVWSVVDVSAPRHEFDSPNPGAKLLVLDLPVSADDSPRITVALDPAQ